MTTTIGQQPDHRPQFWVDARRTEDGHARMRAKIGGMDCSLCSGAIERTLGRQSGVHQVAVSLMHQQALVDYDPDRVSPDQVVGTLRKIGFTVTDPRKARDFDDEKAELAQQGRRTLTMAALSVIATVLMLWELLGEAPGWVVWAVGALAAVSVYTVTRHFKLRRKILNRRVLVASAIGGLAGGLVGLIAAPQGYPTAGFFAVSVLVVAYHAFSVWLSLLIRTSSSAAVQKLLDLQPDTARVVRDGVETEIAVGEVLVGDRVRIRPGERVPVDGRVVEGRSAVDESLVTGESMPVGKQDGSEVVGGSINGTGTLLVEVSRVGADSFLQQVVRHIEDARALKPGILHLVDRVLKIYVPGVLWTAAAAALFWGLGVELVGGDANLNRAVFAGISVLVMGYPCAVGMAAPLAIMRGAADSARHGIVMRTGDAFGNFHATTHIALDKTGTLTEGNFAVREVAAVTDENQLLAVAAAAEASSEHPIGRAIVAAAAQRSLTSGTVEHFDSVSGHGVRARVGGADVVVGKPSYVTAEGADLAPLATRLAELEALGRTVIAVSRDGAALGLIALGDQLRVDARDTVAGLKRRGVTPVLVTGDNRHAARHVADALGIEQVHAEVLPDGKTEIVRALQAQGATVAMVGDGINDAPALMQANVGVAMGAGTHIAIESSDIIIVGNRLDAVLTAVTISKRSHRRTKQNVAMAFGFNAIGVPAAATGLVAPIWAMVVMVVSMLGVFLNSRNANLPLTSLFRGQREIHPERLTLPPGQAHTVGEDIRVEEDRCCTR